MKILSILLLLFFVVLYFNVPPPEQMDESAILSGVSQHHWLGTDELGRDTLSRLMSGALVSLSCALLATLLAGIIGSLVGLVSGYYGGRIDRFCMRCVDVGLAIPDLLLYILLGLFFGRNFYGMVLSLSLLGWLDVARLMRNQSKKTKIMPFIEGAEALGMAAPRLIRQHIFPQCYPLLQTALLMKVPTMILAESSLSFIGLGLSPPQASWGTMASEGYSALQFYPRLIILPTLAIFVSMLVLNLLAKKSSKC